jgi:hypothetical protein
MPDPCQHLERDVVQVQAQQRVQQLALWADLGVLLQGLHLDSQPALRRGDDRQLDEGAAPDQDLPLISPTTCCVATPTWRCASSGRSKTA